MPYSAAQGAISMARALFHDEPGHDCDDPMCGKSRCPSTDPSLYPWATERRCELPTGHDGHHTRHAGDGKALATWVVGGAPMAEPHP